MYKNDLRPKKKRKVPAYDRAINRERRRAIMFACYERALMNFILDNEPVKESVRRSALITNNQSNPEWTQVI